MKLTARSVSTLLGLALSATAAVAQGQGASESPARALTAKEPPVLPAAPPGTQPDQPPEGPQREGFTLEVGLGIGYLNIPSADYARAGLYGLNLGIGGFLNRNLALTLRGTGVYTFQSAGTMTLASALASIQYFATDRITLGGGLGVMVAHISAGATHVSGNPGLAGNARFGVGLVQWKASTLRGVIELNPGRISGTNLVDGGLGLEWQTF